ncbi:hypothetical protein ES705_18640 [subsurface metagenome]
MKTIHFDQEKQSITFLFPKRKTFQYDHYELYRSQFL